METRQLRSASQDEVYIEIGMDVNASLITEENREYYQNEIARRVREMLHLQGSRNEALFGGVGLRPLDRRTH